MPVMMPAEGAAPLIHAMRRRQPHFEKGRARIEQLRHALTRQQFSARNMTFAGFLAAAIDRNARGFRHHVDCRQHRLAVGLEAGASGGNFRFENRHQRVS